MNNLSTRFIIKFHRSLFLFILDGKEAPPRKPNSRARPHIPPSGLILGRLPPRYGCGEINHCVIRGPVTQVGYGGRLALIAIFRWIYTRILLTGSVHKMRRRLG